MSTAVLPNRIRLTRELLHRVHGRRFECARIARRLGVTPATLRYWERGDRQPRVGDALALARDLGVPVEQLWLPFEVER